MTDYLNERQFVQMSDEYASAEVIVIRDGVEVEIPFKDTVVGDIMFLMSGENIEVDGLLVKGFGVTVKESDLTGISFPVSKSIEAQGNPFILAGSVVLDGSGLMLVCAVGKHSNIARKRKTIQAPAKELSPLQTHMNTMVLLLGKIGLGFAICLFVVLMVYLLIDVESFSSDELVERFVSQFILCLTLLIISVPEGLPIALAVSVSMITQQLNNNDCFVRSSQACELLGSIDTLLIEKKGILTKNIMKINYAVFTGIKAAVPNYSAIPEHVKKLVAESVVRNTIAAEDEWTHAFVGNQIECCLLVMVKDWGYSVKDFRVPEKHIAQIPISVQDNKSTTFYVEDGCMKVYSKGNDSLILSRCSHYLLPDGTTVALTNEKRREILENVKNMITDVFMQTISFSYKCTDLTELYNEDAFIENVNENDDNMVYIGTVLLNDQINTRAYLSILNLLKASTQVILVTSDDREMAQHVSEITAVLEQAPVHHHHTLMSAENFRNKVGYVADSTGEQSIECLPLFSAILSKLTVLYNATNEDKLMLAIGLKQLGRVVAITGETINDSHVVKASDIGIALNTSNILVKENSDIILQHDSIKGVESCIRFGRHVNESVIKFLKFQFTLTFVTLIVVSVATISIWDVPLSALQVLVITIVLDAVAAIALAVEPVDKSYSHTHPLRGLINSDFLVIAGTQTIFQVVALLTILWLLPFVTEVEAGWERESFSNENMEHYTIFFASYSFMGLFNLLNVRSLHPFQLNLFRNLSKNKFFIFCWVTVYAMIVLIIEVGGNIFHCAPSSVALYVSANILGILSVVVELCARLVVVRAQAKRRLPDEEPLVKKL